MNDPRLPQDPRIEDAASRESALDPTCSFIVQAPAGSGKTELLIQRYLRLLATVDEPEHVVAMTFTRKAAGEMRERVLDALERAKSPAPREAHAKLTWTLARALQAHDKRRGWALDRHSSRLAIQTIDAWCMRLTRTAPLASGLGLIRNVADDTRALYRSAARRFVFAQPMLDSCATVLAHLDNQADRLIDLIAGMLAQRDQWLPWLMSARRHASLRASVEESWRSIVEDLVRACEHGLPSPVRAHFLEMLAYARHHRIAADPSLEASWPPLDEWPDASCAALGAWKRLVELVLTNGGTWRKQIGNEIGFPPPSQAKGAEHFRRTEQKAAMQALLAALAATPGCLDAWQKLQRAPDLAYADDQWAVVDALLDVLPRAAAELRVVFAEEDVTDFIELSLGALQVLGSDDAPSDILLAYDQRIRHLLIDEFQDTSLTQYALVARLTSGWQRGDGRTLFAVGDPLQSVYRFRGAEVGLFLDARREGIGQIELAPLQLRVNFRSTTALVEWVNGVFERVLPSVEVPAEGVTPFVSAVTRERQLGLEWNAPAELHGVIDERAQGQRVVELVRDARAARPDGDIAILVRTRNHLREVIPALRDAGIAWQAVEIDPLASKQPIIDCLSLTHALLEPADRLAWLSVLRAPWCGLTLADLTHFVAADPHAVVTELLASPERWDRLSPDGRARLARCAPRLVEGVARTARLGVGATVERTWLQLGGPATLRDEDDLADVERYWRLLAEHARDPAFEWMAFVAAIDALYGEAPPPHDGTPPLQIMTMHKAKGLEFGTVIVPGLASPPGGGDPPLLRWRADRTAAGESRLLVAPIEQPGGKESSHYEYLRRRAASEERHELGRLLYVAATRAKHALHWVAVVAPAHEADWMPGKETSLALLWDALGGQWPRPDDGAPEARDCGPLMGDARAQPSQRLFRLPADWQPPAFTDVGLVADAPLEARDVDEPAPPFDWAQDMARAVGIVAHEYLRRFAVDGLAAWSAVRIAAAQPAMRTALAEEGVPPGDLDDALARVRQALATTLHSARGQWILESAHGDARSEYALTAAVEDGRPLRIVIDRTFVGADGTRWIVDFKTSVHRGGDLDAFLEREIERHRPQLESYARVLAAIEARPVRLGLYWPLHDAWREWAPAMA